MTHAPIEQRLDESLQDYWLERVAQHTSDSYAGVTISKFPEDLRTYEHLLWESRASVVVELGTQFGGSALWFRDRLAGFERYGRVKRPLVISIDVDVSKAAANLKAADRHYERSIKLIEGDLGDPEVVRRAHGAVPRGATCLVVEDAAHVSETTRAGLELYSDLVQPDGFYVVEDGCVDIERMRLSPDWPRGVLPALQEWLKTPAGSRFTVRRDLEFYGMSCHPGGFLQRVR